ncbi:helicase associated domain-containing protein [Streptomyces sp. NBC_01717]|uniref:helicase associated domain-containing protein n=1 Tax=Streptomyces sp. NBC_01717 TaxID=2975918 RepID=UPI003FCE55B9
MDRSGRKPPPNRPAAHPERAAWEEGLTATRAWATEHGHLLASPDATHQGYKVGTWLKNQRAAARRSAELEQRRTEGLPTNP